MGQTEITRIAILIATEEKKQQTKIDEDIIMLRKGCIFKTTLDKYCYLE